MVVSNKEPKDGCDLIVLIGDLLSGMPSDQDLDSSDLQAIFESFQIPDDKDLISVHRGVLEWVKCNAVKWYSDIAALEPYARKWSSGPDAVKREIRRRRIFLEELARLLGLALRMVENKATDIRKLTETEKRILSLVKRGLRGEKLCSVLDAEGVPPLPQWKAKWPGGWLAAYKDDQSDIDWKKRITDLVTDLRKRHKFTRHALASNA